MSAAAWTRLDAVAIALMVVSGLALFFGSMPVPGTINWVGGNRTDAETTRAARLRQFWRWAGLLLMVGGAAFQIFRLVCPSSN